MERIEERIVNVFAFIIHVSRTATVRIEKKKVLSQENEEQKK